MRRDPFQSWTSRVWGVALSAFGLVLALNLMVALIRPLIPYLIVGVIGASAVMLWNAHRWR